MTTTSASRPSWLGRIRSKQAGLPSGRLGRIVGRAMVKDTGDANDLAAAALELTQPATVLDIGFGQGRTVENLLEHGHRVLGVDPSPTMVRQAIARNRTACRNGRADLRHGDGINIPFPDESVDAAVTVHTIYFMPDLAATLAEIRRVLKPGGTLAIAARTSDTPPPAWMDAEIYRIPTANQIVELLDRIGFREVHCQHDVDDKHHVRLFLGCR